MTAKLTSRREHRAAATQTRMKILTHAQSRLERDEALCALRASAVK